MTKSQLKKALSDYVGGAQFIRKYELAGFLGAKDPNTVNRYIAGLDRVGTCYYFIDDIAERLLDQRG